MKAQYLSEIMDDLGVSRFTIKILVVVGIAMMFDGFDYMIVSYTMPQIAAEWGSTAFRWGAFPRGAFWGL